MTITQNRRFAKLKVIDRDVIKYIAIFLMFWGHLFSWITLLNNPTVETPYEVMPLWQNILSHLSLFCPPVMFFMVSDGYIYTRDRKKYALRLLVFALITQIPYWILWVGHHGWWGSNVIFTLFFGLLVIMTWESRLKIPLKILIMALLTGATALCMSDWMFVGIVFIIFIHIFRDKPKMRFIFFTAIAFLWKLGAFLWGLQRNDPMTLLYNELFDFFVVMAAYLCMTVFYNGKKGRHPVFAKWFFYAFYPAHYLIILAVYRLSL